MTQADQEIKNSKETSSLGNIPLSCYATYASEAADTELSLEFKDPEPKKLQESDLNTTLEDIVPSLIDDETTCTTDTEKADVFPEVMTVADSPRNDIEAYSAGSEIPTHAPNQKEEEDQTGTITKEEVKKIEKESNNKSSHPYNPFDDDDEDTLFQRDSHSVLQSKESIRSTLSSELPKKLPKPLPSPNNNMIISNLPKKDIPSQPSMITIEAMEELTEFGYMKDAVVLQLRQYNGNVQQAQKALRAEVLKASYASSSTSLRTIWKPPLLVRVGKILYIGITMYVCMNALLNDN